ncbi:PREDICTED: F-box protein At5g46170-like [Tarenaya hassleriana]|uniref:F-box protein At5g46170-like n=1 Tax=Tarenaya hassleriana TaxID=28532 RepID=UPI00053C4340|nr:PREDICTED: F-box protein At5g46170-like [Tarenaya hassleriana]
MDPRGIEDPGRILESLRTSGELGLRSVWAKKSFGSASARHDWLRMLPFIVAEHKLDSLVFTDAEGQGVLSMNRGQLEELRAKPLSDSNRTLVPDMNVNLWYLPHLELPGGTVLKGATLIAMAPREAKKMTPCPPWVYSAFEEPYRTAAKMLFKTRGYRSVLKSFCRNH